MPPGAVAPVFSRAGVEPKPGFALGGWLAFEKMGDQGMVMGDLVLTMDEVVPAMAKLAVGGIDVTALHNHLLRNRPFTHEIASNRLRVDLFRLNQT